MVGYEICSFLILLMFQKHYTLRITISEQKNFNIQRSKQLQKTNANYTAHISINKLHSDRIFQSGVLLTPALNEAPLPVEFLHEEPFRSFLWLTGGSHRVSSTRGATVACHRWSPSAVLTLSLSLCLPTTSHFHYFGSP